MHTLPTYLAQLWEVYNYCATKAQKLSCQHDKTKQPAKLLTTKNLDHIKATTFN